MPAAKPSFGHDDHGASAIEFAILAPVFLLMLTGMLAYGLYFAASHSVQQIAADAARTSVAGLDLGERNALVAHHIATNAGQYLLIETEHLVYEVADRATDPNQYQVIIRYDARHLPIWNLYLPLPLPDTTITFVSSIRHGGV